MNIIVNKTFEFLGSGAGPFALVLLAIIIIPAIDIMLDVLAGRRRLNLKKAKLETIKIRYEIELLKEHHNLKVKDLEKELSEIDALEKKKASKDKLWFWLQWLHNSSPTLAHIACYLILALSTCLSTFVSILVFMSFLDTLGSENITADASVLIIFLGIAIPTFALTHKITRQLRIFSQKTTVS